MQEKLVSLFFKYQKGDEEAFSSLYHLTSPHIWGFIRKRLNVSKHEDCFQNFWMHLHHKKHLYQGQPVLAWMFVVLRNLIIDDYRSQKNHLFFIEDISEDTQEIRSLLEEMLIELPSQDKELIERIYFQGFTYEDLEKEWGLSQTTLRKRLSRGIGVLAKKFKESK